MKQKWDRLTDEQRKTAKDDLIYFFESERNEKIGVIAADQLLDFFLEHVGSKLYNKGLTDARKVIDQRVEELKFDLDDLQDI